MVFSSLFFLFVFLPSSILCNFMFSKSIKLQNFVLMLFSLVFYYWGEQNYIIVMLGCIFINYISGILIDRYENKILKKIFLALAIVISIGLLGYFKYFNFFIDNVNWITGSHIDVAKIILPLGISFYTFHSLSYVIDVYWGKVKSEKK